MFKSRMVDGTLSLSCWRLDQLFSRWSVCLFVTIKLMRGRSTQKTTLAVSRLQFSMVAHTGRSVLKKNEECCQVFFFQVLQEGFKFNCKENPKQSCWTYWSQRKRNLLEQVDGYFLKVFSSRSVWFWMINSKRVLQSARHFLVFGLKDSASLARGFTCKPDVAFKLVSAHLSQGSTCFWVI